MELAAIQLEIEVQGTIFRNTYLSLMRTFLDRQSIAHLGPQWEMYSKLMERLQNLLNTLRLHIDRTRPTNAEDVFSKISSALKPIRFSFGIKQRHGLLHHIKEANSAFQTLVEQRHALRDLTQPLAANAQVSRYRHLRSESSALLSLLISHFDSCTTAHTHSYGFYLRSLLRNPRGVHIRRHSNDRRQNKVWVDSHTRPALEPPVMLEERVVYTLDTCSKRNCCPGSLCQSSRLVAQNRPPPNLDSRKLRLRNRPSRGSTLIARYFARPVSFPSATEQQRLSDAPDRGGSTSVAKSFKWSVCFPSTTEQQHLSNAPDRGAVGALPNRNRHSQLTHAIFYVEERYPLPTDISLHTILSSGTRYEQFPRYFYEWDRVNIAALVALSVVSLHDSNWLDSSFSSNQLFFTLFNDNTSQRLLLEPYVKKQHSVPPLSQSESSSNTQTSAGPPATFGIRNRALYNLGIMLLELVLNESLSSLRVPDLGGALETEDQVAWRLEREVCGKAGSVWADVVSKCLHCPFMGNSQLDDDCFASAVYMDIVQPLLGMVELLDGRLGCPDEYPYFYALRR
ncbi:hypothetical protein BO79DRAFT_256622 [Aspergillus costaricaensis CBS 115574]|uniref:Uncharacterized protein n=1 Tax=Aspergillus costaricaensis CBS 115574 TaxID=1448317 RepID=A0ACD1I9A1_9EURO|nr:hypothetical protein BO79DRAFT_256622 [Aspergillus costaricaensis CBS 115574]RAK87127.1 hypothetical protein BO79DRAFT_256622 [Aspergillus costaricaensis CBS 115574]